jgi:hypothetical protein
LAFPTTPATTIQGTKKPCAQVPNRHRGSAYMKQDEIIKMAREARLGTTLTHSGEVGHFINGANFLEELERFAKMVAEAEREACAKVCEEMRPSKPEYDQRFYDGCSFSAAAIRARGQA